LCTDVGSQLVIGSGNPRGDAASVFVLCKASKLGQTKKKVLPELRAQ
jgi:hypothetical protein